MNKDEVFATVLLNSLPELGPSGIESLIKKFGSAHESLHQGLKEWESCPNLNREVLSMIEANFDDFRKRAEIEIQFIEKRGVRVYLLREGDYPELLREVYSPPPILYVLGEDISIYRPVVALVGSRRCSYYGEKMATRLAGELAERGVTTVSGMARGIDTHIHASSMRNGGKTWAVIGSGLSRLYPPENRSLAKEIEKSGAVITEFPMTMNPLPSNFPRRNRIIAGLSVGTVVVEGREKSGSLITARWALDEGREVFAVPGPAMSPLSAAPHSLLRSGAKMVESADNIIEEFAKPDRDKLLTLTQPGFAGAAGPSDYRGVLLIMGEEPISREVLGMRLKKGTQTLSTLLLDMELKGLIKSIPGGAVVKI